MTRHGDEIERLLSETADAQTPADVARLDELTRRDPLAAEAARRYRALAGRLMTWRRLPSNLPSSAWTALLRDRVRQDNAFVLSQSVGPAGADAASISPRATDDAAASAELERQTQTQDLLDAWARPMPPVDWNALHHRFSTAVRREALRGRGASWRRWAAGIALAASVAAGFLLWRAGSGARAPQLAQTQAPRRAVVTIGTPQETGRVAVQFDQTAPAGEELSPTRRSFGFAASGGQPSAPVDDDTSAIADDDYNF